MEWLSSSWATVGKVVATTVLMYLSAFATTRLAGRRTVAQLSAFDAVVTIALGSVIAATAVTPSTTFGAGFAAFVTLLVLQVTVAWLRRHVRVVDRLVEFPPEVLIREGRVALPEGLLSSQLTKDELWSLLRKEGVFARGEIAVAVLEPTGQISVLRHGAPADDDAVPDRGPVAP